MGVPMFLETPLEEKLLADKPAPVVLLPDKE
jgi:hypothetical protein